MPAMTMKAIDNPANPNGMTLLEITVDNLDIESARAVLRQGADPNAHGTRASDHCNGRSIARSRERSSIMTPRERS
jgi:hypothetical protein